MRRIALFVAMMYILGCHESHHDVVRCRPECVTWQLCNESNAVWRGRFYKVLRNEASEIKDWADHGQNGTVVPVTYEPQEDLPEETELIAYVEIETNDGWLYDGVLPQATMRPCTPPWTVLLRLTCTGLWIEWPEDPEVEPILIEDPENPDICDDIP